MLGRARPRSSALRRGPHPASATHRTWRQERLAIREFIETHCWSERLGSYTRWAGGEDLDASLLLGILFGYDDARDASRFRRPWTRCDVSSGDGSLLSRYSGEDGLRGTEGAFLCCSFWLVDALARVGRLDGGHRAHGRAGRGRERRRVSTPRRSTLQTSELLGNTPQGLVHLALINAAVSISKASAE